MSAAKVCYVVATWHRARQNPEPEKPEEYLKAQVLQLTKLKHNLSKVIFSHPCAMDELYKTFFHPINIPFEYQIIEELTERRSYGSWIHAFKKYQLEYDYYIFIEDDYVPVIDNFDSILVEQLEKKQCGYLCGWKGEASYIHAAIANGIVKSTTLKAIYDKFHAMIPVGYPASYPGNQLGFSHAFLDNEFTIDDYTDLYNSSFWQSGSKELVYMCRTHKDYLIKPVQQFWREG